MTFLTEKRYMLMMAFAASALGTTVAQASDVRMIENSGSARQATAHRVTNDQMDAANGVQTAPAQKPKPVSEDQALRDELRRVAAEARKQGTVSWKWVVDQVAAAFAKHSKYQGIGNALRNTKDAKSRFALIGLIGLRNQLPKDICDEFGGLISNDSVQVTFA